LDLQELVEEVLEEGLGLEHPIVDLVDHHRVLPAGKLVGECLVEEEHCLGLADRRWAAPSTMPNEP